MDQEKTLQSILEPAEFIKQKLNMELSAYESRFERLELEMQKSFKNRNSEA
jgi:hypothetical protein